MVAGVSGKEPSQPSIPNSLGSCPATIVSASPTMNPFNTGSEMNVNTAVADIT